MLFVVEWLLRFVKREELFSSFKLLPILLIHLCLTMSLRLRLLDDVLELEKMLLLLLLSIHSYLMHVLVFFIARLRLIHRYLQIIVIIQEVVREQIVNLSESIETCLINEFLWAFVIARIVTLISCSQILPFTVTFLIFLLNDPLELFSKRFSLDWVKKRNLHVVERVWEVRWDLELISVQIFFSRLQNDVKFEWFLLIDLNQGLHWPRELRSIRYYPLEAVHLSSLCLCDERSLL